MYRLQIENVQNSEIGSQLERVGYDTALMRPHYFKGKACYSRPVTENGRPCYEKDPVTNRMVKVFESVPLPWQYQRIDNALLLRKEQWTLLDQTLVQEGRARLKFWSDLAGASTRSVDGMSVSLLEHETINDPGFATVDMDGLSDGPNDALKYQLEGLPLPVTHCSFGYTKRKLAESLNNGGPGLSTLGASFASRRVMEAVEKVAIGTTTGISYGSSATGYGRTSSVYGLTNFTPRLTKTNMTVPTGSNATTVMSDILACIQQLEDQDFHGPFMVYHSRDWAQFLEADYAVTGGNNPNQTLRDRILRDSRIADIRQLDYLTSTFTMVFIQMTSDVAQAVIGMNPTVLQEETRHGLYLSLKVMAIMVPRFFATQSGKVGLLHATTA